MKNPFRYLKDNWLKYGFETIAIVVGILGAFALSTLHETRKEKETEKEYLVNLLVDYVETVIASNNASYVDKISYQLSNTSLVDLGYT